MGPNRRDVEDEEERRPELNLKKGKEDMNSRDQYLYFSCFIFTQNDYYERVIINLFYFQIMRIFTILVLHQWLISIYTFLWVRI